MDIAALAPMAALAIVWVAAWIVVDRARRMIDAEVRVPESTAD